jgi:hypothetical protein
MTKVSLFFVMSATHVPQGINLENQQRNKSYVLNTAKDLNPIAYHYNS